MFHTSFIKKTFIFLSLSLTTHMTLSAQATLSDITTLQDRQETTRHLLDKGFYHPQYNDSTALDGIMETHQATIFITSDTSILIVFTNNDNSLYSTLGQLAQQHPNKDNLRFFINKDHRHTTMAIINRKELSQ